MPEFEITLFTAQGDVFKTLLTDAVGAEVRKPYAGAGCPKFQFEEAPDGALLTGYNSARNFARWHTASSKAPATITAGRWRSSIQLHAEGQSQLQHEHPRPLT